MLRITGSRLCDELVKINDLLEVTQGVYEEYTAPDPYASAAGELRQCSFNYNAIIMDVRIIFG